MYLVETYTGQGGTACAKALRRKCIVHVSTRERTGVAGAEAVGWVWMAVSGASDGAEPWRFIFLLSATEILIRL